MKWAVHQLCCLKLSDFYSFLPIVPFLIRYGLISNSPFSTFPNIYIIVEEFGISGVIIAVPLMKIFRNKVL